MSKYNKDILASALSQINGWRSFEGLSANQIRKANILKHELKEFMEENGITDTNNINQADFNTWKKNNTKELDIFKPVSIEMRAKMGVSKDAKIVQLY